MGQVEEFLRTNHNVDSGFEAAISKAVGQTWGFVSTISHRDLAQLQDDAKMLHQYFENIIISED